MFPDDYIPRITIHRNVQYVNRHCDAPNMPIIPKLVIRCNCTVTLWVVLLTDAVWHVKHGLTEDCDELGMEQVVIELLDLNRNPLHIVVRHNDNFITETPFGAAVFTGIVISAASTGRTTFEPTRGSVRISTSV